MIQAQLEQELLEIYRKNQELATQLLEKQILSLKDIEKVLGSERTLLGEILIKEKLILKYELELALKEQEKTQKKLGEILIERRMIFPFQLERVLIKQI